MQAYNNVHAMKSKKTPIKLPEGFPGKEKFEEIYL
jgi:hypothetical protein